MLCSLLSSLETLAAWLNIKGQFMTKEGAILVFTQRWDRVQCFSFSKRLFAFGFWKYTVTFYANINTEEDM